MDADKIGVCPLVSKMAVIFLSSEFSFQAELNFLLPEYNFTKYIQALAWKKLRQAA